MAIVHVAAGLIWRKGRVLICQRGPSKAHSHLWEFPGGKLEAGETPLDCLTRELEEELGIRITADSVIAQGRDVLPDGRELLFHFVQGYLPQGEPVCSEHEALCWALPRELANYTFCPADHLIARQIAAQPRFTHFIWDFDGTLMNSYPAMAAGFREALTSLGHPLPLEEVMQAVKRSVSYACRHYADALRLDPQIIMERYRHYESRRTPHALPYPGMLQCLQALKAAGAHHHLYTHRGPSALTYLEKHIPPEFFEGVITSRDGYPAKPAPDALNALAQRLHLPPSACLMVGDRDIDVMAGLNAGMQGCLFDPDGYYAGYEAAYTARSFPMLMERFGG